MRKKINDKDTKKILDELRRQKSICIVATCEIQLNSFRKKLRSILILTLEDYLFSFFFLLNAENLKFAYKKNENPVRYVFALDRSTSFSF